ncbi:TIR domain-containing protein [Succinivibrio dextrinosolvens]|uniref:toll/interleukin-1 receptor domain-containing protein n=1 Tax=Succinivibrio dextrinosolvens TaxID=83771 RepID=UPI0008F0B055|nr:toll/interleukin-1 receptor domain-containing protein [Succinivibrio dextrinosolvens]SFS87026.1 TIR domain-containing protein [Succinivibrio dextrinosolvens]
MGKPIIFISHTHEEKELAISLKNLIEESFLGITEVFVSSDSDSIKLGSKWLDCITYSLSNCVIELLICSSNSISKPWINFEAGAGWIRKSCKVIPICHSGLLPESLPLPLNLLQGMVISEESNLQELFNIISIELKCKRPSPDYKSFILTIRDLEKKYTYGYNIKTNLDKFLDFIRKYCSIEVNDGLGKIKFDKNIAFLDLIKNSANLPRFLVNSDCLDASINDCLNFLDNQKILQIKFNGSIFGPDGYSKYFFIKKLEHFDESLKFYLDE